MNLGYDNQDLKPYCEPTPDFKDERRIGKDFVIAYMYTVVWPLAGLHLVQNVIPTFLCSEIMLQMGFSRDEIQEALSNNRYDEVMATYLLLDERRQKLTVSNISFLPWWIYFP